ncbi:MAG: hypothetical protein CFE23_03055 [Flavobacterium sp. BFFFF1]|uniref:hypothetical protein n=1 Tax=Flavobacterium sp. BFFFF1 TaxID=2015557 RepID=UPI000BC9D90E|nr:hypothetical protein [Flavobacterium sp. BFFFF1]OYU81867.1 MAG: hypothetical protein CFE23_03055 [Flavobacterium sp. BFFFF1]
MKSLSILVLFFLLSVNTLFSQSDCVDAIVVCGNSGFSGLTVSGPGNQELNNNVTCGSSENNSIWLRLDISTTGTLGFELIPESNSINEDFDFFIFGPNPTCSNLGATIRCSTTNPASINQSDNHTGLNSSESDTSEGPGAGGNSFLSILNVTAGQFYYLVIDRPVGNSNFSIQWTGTASFNTPPSFELPSGVDNLNLRQCDVDGIPDNSSAFDLTQNTPLIIGTQTNVTVTYYTNQNDAIVGNNAITGPTFFPNTQNPQTIFARIENNTTHCFTNTDFTIGINDDIAFPVDSFAVCDDAADGDDTNGKATFNMDAVTAGVFTGNDLSGFDIRYYVDQDDADANQNQLPQFFNNTIPFQQRIIIKATNGTCIGTHEINLIVNPLPDRITADYVQCDYDENADGISQFNIRNADRFFTGNPDVEISYFEDMQHVQDHQSVGDSFTNATNPQTILVQQTNLITGCTS